MRGAYQSEFAECLEHMLDESRILKRSEWAAYLGTSVKQLRRWVADRGIPPAETLGMIIRRLEASDNVPPKLLKHFDRLSQEPWRNVTYAKPHDGVLTLGQYLCLPRIQYLHQRLARLPRVTQNELQNQIEMMLTAAEKQERVA